MSGSASLDLERLMLGHTLAIAPMATLSRVYVALCRTAPTEAAGGKEVTGAGYARPAATFTLLAVPANAAANATAVDFAPATGDWGTVTHFEIWTQATGGTRLYWGQLVDPADGVPIGIEVTAGNVLRFSPGTLVVQATDMDPVVIEDPGPFLPTAGGTMTGPLLYPATGGIALRPAQDRAADVVNVLEFGADPTGVADSTAAFNAAIASRPFNNAHVFIPAGRYTITGAVTLGAGCVIYGAGRQMTLIQIPTSFNMSALGVFVLGSDPAHSGTPTIRDLWIRFTQPNFAGMTRADLVQYPPAVYKAAASATGRPNFENLMISSAWIGFDLDNCAAYLNNIYMSALSYGFLWSKTTPTLDIVRISNVHFWGFDILSTSPIGVIFLDGTTNCGWFGHIDGLMLTNFFSESSIITIDAGPNPPGGYYFFQEIGLDGPAKLIINSNTNLQCDSISNSRGTDPVRYATPGVIINGGRNEIFNSYLASSMPSAPMISVQGGSLSYHGGTTAWPETDTPFMVCSGGNLEVRDVTFATHLGTARTTPIISQTGAGYVMVTGCRFGGFPAASVPPISITTSANAFVDANNYGGMTQRLPVDYLTISYGNRSIRGDAASATTAQLALRGIGTTNGLESKLRFHGTFDTGTDYSQYLAASIRAGFTTGGWGGGYLDIWLASTSNSILSDAGTAQVARFTTTAATFTVPITVNMSGPTIRSGTGAATGTQPAGSLWLRTDGSAGARLYVSAGGGTWTPVAGV